MQLITKGYNVNTLRNELKANYSQIPNELITDLSLSSGALRVLLYLFTKPDNWNVYNADICKQLNISEKTLTKYWSELLSSKWLRREKKQTKDGKFTGGYSYLIGSFTISEESSESVECSDHSNNKLIQKKETNNNKYDIFLDYLKSKCKYKSKVTKTKDGKVLFNQIEDKRQLIIDYIRHQEEKKEFAVVITKFMEDYNTVYKDKYNPNNNDEWSDGAIRCDPNEFR